MVVGCQPCAPATFTPRKHFWYSFLLDWRWGGNINILKPECLAIGSDIQNMKREDNIESKGTTAFRSLGSTFTNSSECTHEVLNTIEPARKAT